MIKKGWREKATRIHPLYLINGFFAVTVTILLLQGLTEYRQEILKLKAISERARGSILTLTHHTTDNIFEIMENPKEIYTVDPLIEMLFSDLSNRDGIDTEMIQPAAQGLPEELTWD